MLCTHRKDTQTTRLLRFFSPFLFKTREMTTKRIYKYMKCERKLDIYRYLLCIKSKWRPNMQYVFTVALIPFSPFLCHQFHFLLLSISLPLSFAHFSKPLTLVRLHTRALARRPPKRQQNIMFYYYYYLCGKHIVFGMRYMAYMRLWMMITQNDKML